ncbi:MAG TPA: DUF1697 domain-containing protein [Verrucomicrobiae bacterium]|nr:DUF1697 domain-containing protein [Verrucomicrobiae bacterium]
MKKYIAFLRGINVGGNKPVKMEDLKKAFATLEFQNVKTLLTSGNVLFETAEPGENNLVKKAEEKLNQTFGHEIGVLARSLEEIQELVRLDPFKRVKVTPQTRLYVTFLSQKPKKPRKVPYESPGKDFRILRVSDREVCSVLTLSPNWGTTDLMAILEKEFGPKITTRNWNTIVKILEAAA